MPSATQVANLANPHAVASIMKASESCQIVAHEDILDENGVKLWAKNQPVSLALQQKLLERKLRQPIESCLRADDGVTHRELAELGQRLYDSKTHLRSGISPWAKELLEDIPHLPLHPVAQLLLTAARGSSPKAYEHAVMSMLMAGAMAIYSGGDRYQQRMSMLGGLLHDIGELYIQPDYLNSTTPLTPQAWRSICVHPRVGAMLLQNQTDYPQELSRAISEHHERGNGMGYPTQSKHLTALGSRLSAVEAMMGILNSERADAWEHAALAMKLVPGEFDPVSLAFASQAASRLGHQASQQADDDADADQIWEHALTYQSGLLEAQREAGRLATLSPAERVRATAGAVANAAEQLLKTCNALGIWAPRHLTGKQVRELRLANTEMDFRIQTLQRTFCWTDEGLAESERSELEKVWHVLRHYGHLEAA